jgi:pimeloyl-ACP methyl ester carboxylesterase
MPTNCSAPPFYGDSIPAGRERDLSVAHQTDYLLAGLDALEIDRAVFVGHDLCGGVAQIAAVREPDPCAGIVLTNATATTRGRSPVSQPCAPQRQRCVTCPPGRFRRSSGR